MKVPIYMLWRYTERSYRYCSTTNRPPPLPILTRIWDGSWSSVCYRMQLAKIRVRDAS